MATCFVTPEAVIGDQYRRTRRSGWPKNVEELQQHNSTIRRGEAVPQVDHENQDQQSGARCAKDIDGSTLFDIYKAFATPEETAAVEKQYAEGIAWGAMKQQLFEYINDHISPAREEYDRLIADPATVEAELLRGAERAREVAAPYMQEIRSAIGIRRLG